MGKNKLGMAKLSLIAVMFRIIYFATSIKGFLIFATLTAVSWYFLPSMIAIFSFIIFGYFSLFFIINKVVHLEINDYILVNRLCGSIHMNYKFRVKYIKSDNDAVNLRHLYRNFLAGIYEIPSKTKYSPLLRFRKKYYTKTHEAIFKIALKEYNLTENDYKLLKESIVREKLMMKPIKTIFDDKQYKILMRKTKKYKIYINMDDVKVAVKTMKQLNS